MATVQARSARLDLPDDVEAVYAHFEENGFSDGHPVIPPTVERVERFLAAGSLSPDKDSEDRAALATGARVAGTHELQQETFSGPRCTPG